VRRLLWLLIGAAGLLTIAAVLSGVGLRNVVAPDRDRPRLRLCHLPELLRLDPRLRLITLAMFLFYIGLGATHCYIMPLFFRDKFGVSYGTLGWILCLHRLSISIPLLLAGQIVRGRAVAGAKFIVALFMTLEGLALVLAGLLPGFWWATGVWLFHDFFGAGIWSPVNNTLMQRYSRGHARGNDVALSMSASYLGFVLGAVLGGLLYTERAAALLRGLLPLPGSGPVYGLPFIVGGLFMTLACPFYIYLHFVDKDKNRS
jgi:predicted MFS family arabinose efflux permease